MAKVIVNIDYDRSKILQEISGLFDVLRNESIRNDDYIIVLFLLLLYRDINAENFNKISSSNFVEDVSKYYLKVIGQDFEARNTLLDAYIPIFTKVSDSGIESMLNILKGYNRKSFIDNFCEIFDDLLVNFSKSFGKSGGEFLQPLELTSFIYDLVELNKHSKIYNPFAGVASFGVFLKNGATYHGQEINKATWHIGLMRIMAYQREGTSDYVLGNSITEWNPKNEKYDLIVSNFPFNQKLPKEIAAETDENILDNYVIKRGIESLSDSGSLILVIPEGFFFKSGREYQLRKYLIDNDLIELIAKFPGGLLYYSSIPIYVLKISKNKQDKDLIKLIDCGACVDTNNRERKINLYKLNSLLKGNKSNDIVVEVNRQEIINYEYNLSVPRYLLTDFNGENLKSICSLIHGERIRGQFKGRFVRIRDLKDNEVNNSLDIDSVESREISRASSKISESCLLVALRWKTLKPTIFEYNGEPIYITNDILALKVNNEIVDIQYLIKELHSEAVIKQIHAYSLGSTIPMIRKSDFLAIKINIPTIEKQYSEISERNRNLILNEQSKLKLLQEDLGISIADQNSFLRHKISGPVKNVRGSFKSLNEIVQKLDMKSEIDIYNQKVNDKSMLTLRSYMDIIERDLINIHQAILTTGDEIELMEYNPERIDITKFLSEYSKNLETRKERGFKIDFWNDKDDLKVYKVKKVYMYADKSMLRKLFDNLVDNAEKHGFDNSISVKNILQIALQYDFEDMQMQIDFSNTGNPLPENFSLESFKRRGSKTGKNAGDGTGGWLINTIVKKHGGKLSWTDETVDSLPGSDMVTTFEMYFPIEIENYE